MLRLLLLIACMAFLTINVPTVAQKTSGTETAESSQKNVSPEKLIQTRVDFLNRKIGLDKDQLDQIFDIVATHCFESHEEYLEMESQADWEKAKAAKRRQAFDVELRGALKPQQYVKFLLVKKKFYKKYPFGKLF